MAGLGVSRTLSGIARYGRRMGFSARRAVRRMDAPVRGIFRVTGFHDARPGTVLTGVLTAPGIPAASAEHRADSRGRWVGNDELPIVVDAADPASFVVLWDEVEAVSWASQQKKTAQHLADRLGAAEMAPGVCTR
jgi:hypothetical protein